VGKGFDGIWVGKERVKKEVPIFNVTVANVFFWLKRYENTTDEAKV
jgi:hypothetical protein